MFYKRLQILIVVIFGLILSGCSSSDPDDTVSDSVSVSGKMIPISGKIEFSSINISEKFEEIKDRKIYLTSPDFKVQTNCTLTLSENKLNVSGAYGVKDGIALILLVPDVKQTNGWFVLELGLITGALETGTYDFGLINVESQGLGRKLLYKIREFNGISAKFSFGDYTLNNMMLDLFPEASANYINSTESIGLFTDSPGDMYFLDHYQNISRLLRNIGNEKREPAIQLISLNEKLLYHPKAYSASVLKVQSGIPVSFDIFSDSNLISYETDLESVLSLHKFEEGIWYPVASGTEVVSAGWNNTVQYNSFNEPYKKMTMNVILRAEKAGFYKLRLDNPGSVEAFNQNGTTSQIDQSDLVYWDQPEILVYVE